ncbi:3'-5' exonuclease [Gorillibacterium timonense]|uniref:3'-5' exonuclease n=1 Tax=Gorillibacterium timonense TaxID=1689269 RepID=UPI00071CE3E1|nr:3'-5' exonuclease [Gorillibacterium timonense]
MLYIIYDLEMTVCRKKNQISEIIEIGAAKVTEQDGQLVVADTFQAFVQPVKNPVLTKSTIEFTGITQENVRTADPFPEALAKFLAWIGTSDYYLCSWGPDDKLQFVRECRSHKLDMTWIRNHNNLQRQLTSIRKQEKHQQMGLKAALEWLEIPFSGSHHRAMDDAFNTAQIFVRLADQMKLELNEFAEEKREDEIVYKTGHFANNPFGNLADLLEEEPYAG